ncbi:MAG: hypothetical protein ACP5C3_02055 [Methanomicrobiales archaeon]
MRKQAILLTLSFIFIISICGAVAAADESDGGITENNELQGTEEPTTDPPVGTDEEANPDPPLDITKGS